MEATEPYREPVSVPARPRNRLPPGGLDLPAPGGGAFGAALGGTPQDVCQLLRQLIAITEPPNDVKTLTFTQGRAGANGFGSGGGNLIVVQNGKAVATQISPVPPNVRTVVLRNLSTSTELLYWFSNVPQATPPSNAYAHLPEDQAIALDVWDVTYLYVMADPAATDAGVDVDFLWYNPEKVPT